MTLLTHQGADNDAPTAPDQAQDPAAEAECNDNRKSEQRQAIKRHALKARSALPPYILANYVLTDAEAIVLAFHIRFSDLDGTHDKPIKYIETVTGLSRRTIQNASIRLGAGNGRVEGLNLIVVTKRRLTPHDNDTNVYALSETLYQAVSGRIGGAKVPTVRGPSLSHSPKSLTRAQKAPVDRVKKERSKAAQVSSRFASESPSKEANVESPQQKRPQSVVTMKADLVRKSRLCLLILGDDPGDVRKITTAHDACKRIDELRREKAPNLYTPIWEHGLRKHGEHAYLAVLETLILAKLGHVRRTPGQYLAGILKKPARGTVGDPQQECRPEETIEPFLLQRFGPSFCKPSNLKLPPLEVIETARIDDGELKPQYPGREKTVLGVAVGTPEHQALKNQWGV